MAPEEEVPPQEDEEEPSEDLEEAEISLEEQDRRRRIGKILKRWRKEARLTQPKLAERVGINKTTLGRYEKGYSKEKNFPRRIPTEILFRIAQACGADPSEALQEEMEREIRGPEVVRQILGALSTASEKRKRAALEVLKIKDPLMEEIVLRVLGIHDR